MHCFAKRARSPPSPLTFPISIFTRRTRLHHSLRTPNTSLPWLSFACPSLLKRRARVYAAWTMRVCLRIAAKAKRHTGSEAERTLPGSSIRRNSFLTAFSNLFPSPVSLRISSRKLFILPSSSADDFTSPESAAEDLLAAAESKRARSCWLRMERSSGITPLLMPPCSSVHWIQLDAAGDFSRAVNGREKVRCPQSMLATRTMMTINFE
mmetsp:Transcript_3390/g.6699  ORF Transcript_3390/g.6699 Transcript_3390/m.6699 type:complete len:209 (+) Transcript_3390:17241-17867(+)